MTVAFVVAAAGLVAAASAVLVFPMLRADRKAGQLRGSFGWIAAIVLVLAFGTISLYRLVGTPAALQRNSYTTTAPSSNVDDTLPDLQAAAAQHPGELLPWLLLGRSAATMQRPDVALDAFGHALRLAPDNPDIMVAYAEAFAVQRVDHHLDAATRAVLERALTINPNHQHGLMLLGVADYQDGRFADAANRWKQLRHLLPPDASITAAITSQIDNAEARKHAAGR